MVCFLLEAVRVNEVAFFQTQFLGLSVHFVNESFDVVFVTFVWEFESLVYQVVNITLFVAEVINFTFHSNYWHL